MHSLNKILVNVKALLGDTADGENGICWHDSYDDIRCAELFEYEEEEESEINAV